MPSYPNLTATSAQSTRNDHPGGFYSPADYAELLAYAAARFVTVVPEFDSPGHAASVLRAYPELGTPEMHAAPESLQYLDPSVPAVWDLVGAVYEEMARVHPAARIHVGGDEAIAMPDAAFADYVETALAMARSTGKGIVAWQETARAGFAGDDVMQLWISPHLVERVRQANEDLDHSWVADAFPDPAVRDAFVQAFLKAPDDLPKSLDQGATVLISRADVLYLDTRYTEDSADPAQAKMQADIGLPASIYGSGTVADAFDWDPATIEPDLPLERIAGVEGAIWSDTITDEQELLFQLLPRLPGVAEKGWSDPGAWAAYHPRLAAQRRVWDAMGVTYFVSPLVWPEG
jgi:hexosaminidase